MSAAFADKRVFVSGSSGGIGLAIAANFHSNGATVGVNGRNATNLESVGKRLGAVHFVGDVADPQQSDRLAREVRIAFGGIDILVCNAGLGKSVPAGCETAAEWQRMIELNLFSGTNLVRAFLPLFPESGGAIICISSICGVETLAAPVAYSVAKAALNAYVSGMARPLAAKNIRINAVAPGNIHFPGGTWERLLAEDQAKVHAMLDSQVAMKRFGRPEEIADAVSFLASDKATFITGTVLVVDGGQVRSHL